MRNWTFLRESGVQCSSQMSILELTLFTSSLITSIMLSLIPSNRALARHNRGTPSLVTIISTILALIALAVSLTSLVLGWIGLISLEALSTVIFGLIPALLAMPVDTVLHALLRRSMSSYKSLALTSRGFRYATVKVLHTIQNEGNSAIHPEFSADEIVVFIKHISTQRSSRLLQRKQKGASLQTRRNSFQVRQMIESRLGKILSDEFALWGTKNTLTVQKEVFTSRDRWWISVSSATWLIAKPWLVHLQTKMQVIQALALLSDVISIGRVVLYFRRAVLQRHLQNNRMLKRGLSGTISIVCNSLIRELGLEDWGRIDPTMTLSATDDPVQRPKEHGVLFYIMSGMSDLYGMKSKRYEGVASEIVLESKGSMGQQIWSSNRKGTITRISAQTVLDHLREEDFSQQEFKEFLADRVDDWLFSWGCQVDKGEKTLV